jgi:hypothetical protein
VLVSAIVINYNGGELLLECLRSLSGQQGILETIIVDNASSDGSLDRALEEFPDVIAVRDTVNRGRAVAPNRGAAVAHGDILMFLDHDAVLAPGCVAALASALCDEPGVAGPVLRNGPERIEQWGMTIDWLGFPLGLRGPGAPLFINGPVFATNRSLFERLGGFESRFFYAAEDVDYCWRALLSGAAVRVVPEARADHLGGGGGTTPGGYLRQERIETTDFRVAMRERNTLAILITCAPAAALPLLIPAYVAKSLTLATVALGMGRRRLARELLRGLWWNAQQLPTTLRRRGRTTRTPRGAREARRRIERRLRMLTMVREHGLPRFVDASR